MKRIKGPASLLGVLLASSAPLLLAAIVGAAAMLAAGCGDNLDPLPGACALDEAAHEAHCQRACLGGAPAPGELCSGGEAQACYLACSSCDLGGPDWCPAVVAP